MLCGNSDAFVVAIYAGWRLGGIVVPVNPRSAAPEIDYFITDFGARPLLFGAELAQTVRSWHERPDRLADIPALALGETAGFEDVLPGATARSAEPVGVTVAEDDNALTHLHLGYHRTSQGRALRPAPGPLGRHQHDARLKVARGSGCCPSLRSTIPRPSTCCTSTRNPSGKILKHEIRAKLHG